MGFGIITPKVEFYKSDEKKSVTINIRMIFGQSYHLFLKAMMIILKNV